VTWPDRGNGWILDKSVSPFPYKFGNRIHRSGSSTEYLVAQSRRARTTRLPFLVGHVLPRVDRRAFISRSCSSVYYSADETDGNRAAKYGSYVRRQNRIVDETEPPAVSVSRRDSGNESATNERYESRSSRVFLRRNERTFFPNARDWKNERTVSSLARSVRIPSLLNARED